MADRSIPYLNRTCQARWDTHIDQIQKRNIQNIKPRIDTTSPPKWSHLQTQSKRQLMQRLTRERIQRDNVIMLKKLRHTMIVRQSQYDKAPFRMLTLNEDGRRHEAERIQKENDRLLVAIRQGKPNYSVKQWETDNRKKDKLIHNISQFPSNPIAYAALQRQKAKQKRLKGQRLKPLNYIESTRKSNDGVGQDGSSDGIGDNSSLPSPYDHEIFHESNISIQGIEVVLSVFERQDSWRLEFVIEEI